MRGVTLSLMRSAKPQSKESLLQVIAGNSYCGKLQPQSAMEQQQHLQWRNIWKKRNNGLWVKVMKPVWSKGKGYDWVFKAI